MEVRNEVLFAGKTICRINPVERMENLGGPQRQYFEIPWVYISGVLLVISYYIPIIYTHIIYPCTSLYNTSPERNMGTDHWINGLDGEV